MIITVKILQGQECSVEVTAGSQISVVKQLVARELHIPVDQQRLVFKGKTLADAQCVGDYNIVDGNKLHLVVRKDDADEHGALYAELDKFLVRHFSKKDAAKIVDYYKKGLEGTVESLSLDDIERIAQSNLHQNYDEPSSSKS